MITVSRGTVRAGPDSTITALSLSNVRSVNFLKSSVIIIETEDGTIREVDSESLDTVTVAVSGADLTFTITGT
jgi:hypothetical protein